MKTAFFLFFLLVMLATLKANAGLPPTTLGGQQSASKPTTFNFKAPNYQATQTLGTTSLIETGNKNILANPSYEHPTVPSGSANASSWIASATSISLSTAAIDGSQALLLVSSAAAITATQDSTLYASELDDGVQCLAQVRVKGDVPLQVCARQAGVTSTTDCVTTNTDNKWGLYKIPFICGATSNGISIASSGSVTGGAYIDDAFVGPVDLKVDTNNISNTVSYTPTVTVGSGSITNYSVTANWKRVGDTLAVSGYILFSGASAAFTDINIGIPSGLTIGGLLTTGSVDGSTSAVDAGVRLYPSSTIEASNGGTSVLIRASTIDGFTGSQPVKNLQYSNTYPFTFGASDSIQFNFKVPIAGWSSSGSIYSASCGANCVDTFSAKVSSTGVVSSENTDWISGNGSCSSGNYSLTLKSGIGLTSGMNCSITNPGTRDRQPLQASTSSTTITFSVQNSAGAGICENVNIICQKQGSDFVATRTIVGSFNEVVTAPGVSKPKTCYYAFGGASATLASPTECTTGTCVEVYDSCGSGSPPSRGAAGNYNDITFASGTWKASSPVSCFCQPVDGTSDTARDCTTFWITGDDKMSSNSNGGMITNIFTGTTAGTGDDVAVMLKCEGQSP